jgi:hypothetical protein
MTIGSSKSWTTRVSTSSFGNDGDASAGTYGGYAGTTRGKTGFTAEAQSTQRFYFKLSSFSVLSASAVNYPGTFVIGKGVKDEAKN